MKRVKWIKKSRTPLIGSERDTPLGHEHREGWHLHSHFGKGHPHEKMKIRMMQGGGFARSSQRRLILDAKAEIGSQVLDTRQCASCLDAQPFGQLQLQTTAACQFSRARTCTLIVPRRRGILARVSYTKANYVLVPLVFSQIKESTPRAEINPDWILCRTT